MTLSLEKKWVWDSWYIKTGSVWHCFYLQADKSLVNPDLRHFNVTQGHATSTDLTTWQHHGTCFSPSQTPAWDDSNTWTGSVIKDDEGVYHLFYTGLSHKEKSLYQRIGHAVSDDLHSWCRVDDGLCLDLVGENASFYESDIQLGHWHDRAMRDPWVIRNPDGKGWLMYFTARASGIAEPNDGGAIGFATSDDLYSWTLQPPVFVGGFGQMEVPQVFEIDNRWYCLFCTNDVHWSQASINSHLGPAVSGNHYLIADSPFGPWHLPDTTFFDGHNPCYRYAARILETDNGHVIIGFHDQGKDGFVGEILNPEPISTNDKGLLVFNNKRAV